MVISKQEASPGQSKCLLGLARGAPGSIMDFRDLPRASEPNLAAF